jgi:hypothetical protein
MTVIRALIKFIKIFLPKATKSNFQDIRPLQMKGAVLADIDKLGKAINFTERFREILSDPLNILIERVPEAGYLKQNMEVTLHNGISVPVVGEFTYYGGFSDILVINRGVHEPLEEFCFQELLRLTEEKRKDLTMLELGAYWGHYSMWFKKALPNANCILVEPEKRNLHAGERNFRLNGLEGNFINDAVSSQNFTVDKFLNSSSTNRLYLLHSDIQGFELEMLQHSKIAMTNGLIDYIMISTHSRRIHFDCVDEIAKYDYSIEVSSEPDCHTTSCDGFLFARKNSCRPIIGDAQILGRVEIARSSAKELVEYVSKIHKQLYKV